MRGPGRLRQGQSRAMMRTSGRPPRSSERAPAIRRRSWGAAPAALSAAEWELGLHPRGYRAPVDGRVRAAATPTSTGPPRAPHATHRGADRAGAALRCAIWIGLHHAQRGEIARAGGWLARAERLLEQLGGELRRTRLPAADGVFELKPEASSRLPPRPAGEAAAITSASATATCTASPRARGAHPDRGGADERGPRAARRDDARGCDQQAVANHHRHRLLRRDPSCRGARGPPAREWTTVLSSGASGSRTWSPRRPVP